MLYRATNERKEKNLLESRKPPKCIHQPNISHTWVANRIAKANAIQYWCEKKPHWSCVYFFKHCIITPGQQSSIPPFSVNVIVAARKGYLLSSKRLDQSSNVPQLLLSTRASLMNIFVFFVHSVQQYLDASQ